MTSTRK